MAWDINKLEQDAGVVIQQTGLMGNTIAEFRGGQVAGVAHTTAQKAALRDKFIGEYAAAQVAMDALQAQIDANP